jgi:CRISPR system Cascade subunit CasE
MNEPLYLMHCVPDLARLTLWAQRHGWLTRQGDLGYALHALLRSAFGDMAPQPFAYQGERAGLLGYTHHAPALLAEAAALASPEVAAALGLQAGPMCPGLNVRAMPNLWRSGQVLGFEVRLRPTQRNGRSGLERDVFLCAVEQPRAPDVAPPQREIVYLDWLAAQFTRHAGAKVLDASVTGFMLSDVVRRRQAGAGEDQRAKRHVGGPEARFSGLLEVGDPQAFVAGLARGLGRHRAFGLGMVLLKPAARALGGRSD